MTIMTVYAYKDAVPSTVNDKIGDLRERLCFETVVAKNGFAFIVTPSIAGQTRGGLDGRSIAGDEERVAAWGDHLAPQARGEQGLLA